jgi:hypothetical protein
MLEGIGLFIAGAGITATILWLVVIVTKQEDAFVDWLLGKEE